jgi:sulfur carrier protein
LPKQLPTKPLIPDPFIRVGGVSGFFYGEKDMNVFINGRPEAITPCSLAELVRQRDLPGESLVVELNMAILKQSEWPATILQEGDRLELLSFVGGG